MLTGGFTPNQAYKQDIATRFSRAATTYDSVADLQREVADTLLSDLPLQTFERVVDLGCGTGYGLPTLRNHYPSSQLLALDIAQGMLQQVKSIHAELDLVPLCADAEALPLADEQIDLIWSSLAVQWCSDYPRLFTECCRVLKPGGRLMLATLGPKSLFEMREAWQSVDQLPHVNRFAPLDQLLVMPPDGLRLLKSKSAFYTLTYPDLRAVMKALKMLGASAVEGRQSIAGLGGRERLQQLASAYDNFRQQEGCLPVSYEVYYLQWCKD
ncbi:malonyl-ACP O-methyltransferase BioC [Nitrincola iocasae]|uniref:Malonyl-[acyl-carrier protein] O-methyltransferase n=1 Tax=Nitrincola iocasae TaxID=2614693 RepID=A0A5J6LBN0_9GAMM|nr:malonyl-ACP O-methyltransferase BioC [Nitrincola iocasae]QEW05612.1 malonyl-ACP O-methyltransferase BioC [Nitrincola iocasae]